MSAGIVSFTCPTCNQFWEMSRSGFYVDTVSPTITECPPCYRARVAARAERARKVLYGNTFLLYIKSLLLLHVTGVD